MTAQTTRNHGNLRNAEIEDVTPTPRLDWKEEFKSKFPCIQSDCDGHGNIPVLVSGSRQISDTEFEQVQEWEAEQCEFHAKYLFPMEDFISSLLTRQKERMVETIEERVKVDLTPIEESISAGMTASEAQAVYDNGYLYNEAVSDTIQAIKEIGV